MITLALSKGRIFDDALPLLRAADIEVLDDPEKSRKLILDTNRPDVRVLVVRATDVPTYVQYGGAALDMHLSGDPIGFDYAASVRQGSRLTVATKYMSIARDFFATKGVHADLVKLYGSMELAPLTGIADAIVDLVSTGSTLRANNLVEVERIMDISARLVVNQAALKLKPQPMRRIIDAFDMAVRQNGAKECVC